MSAYKMFEGKKASFSELAEAEDNLLHNSNMLNLVAAQKSVVDEIEGLVKRKEFLEALKVEIEDYAENGDILNTSKIKELFEKKDVINNMPIKKRW